MTPLIESGSLSVPFVDKLARATERDSSREPLEDINMADLPSEEDEYESEDSAWGEEDRAASQILGDTASHQLSAAKTADGRTTASAAQWFSYKPATYPPSLNKFAETFTEDWAAGRNTVTRHHGGRSRKNLLRWFQAWMGRIQDVVTAAPSSSAKNNNDQGRHHRWLGHLKEFMFRTKGPKRDDHETVEEYQALLREREVIRDGGVGCPLHFELRHEHGHARPCLRDPHGEPRGERTSDDDRESGKLEALRGGLFGRCRPGTESSRPDRSGPAVCVDRSPEPKHAGRHLRSVNRNAALGERPRATA